MEGCVKYLMGMGTVFVVLIPINTLLFTVSAFISVIQNKAASKDKKNRGRGRRCGRADRTA